jgi:hypothetical protein
LGRAPQHFGERRDVLAAGAASRFDQKLGHVEDFLSLKSRRGAILSLEIRQVRGVKRIQRGLESAGAAVSEHDSMNDH